MISALILTLNEERNIGDCIAALPWRDDVRVLDSVSTDRTAEVAAAHGAKVVVRPFTNYADQRNFGLAFPWDNEWIVCLDADERMTPDLAAEIERTVEGAAPDAALYRVRRRDMFMGRWLRRASGYPTYFPRLFRRGRVRVLREINEIYEADGAAFSLQGHIEHFPFNKGLDWWFERHNRYSRMEAVALLGERTQPLRLGEMLSADPGARRAALKRLAYRLPGRPVLVFLYLYLVRGGVLDGAPGFHYASMRLAYEIMIDAKLAAAQRGGA